MEEITDTNSTSGLLREKRRELKQETCKIKREAILRNKRIRLTEEEANFKKYNAKETENLAFELKSGKKDVACLRAIKRAAAEGEENIQSFLRISGALYALVGILTGSDAEKQAEAAGCIINLATGSHKSTFKLLKATGAYLITYLHGSSPFLQDHCAWALGNMIADSPQCCSHLKAQGLLPGLTGLLQSTYPSVVQSVVFALRTYTASEEEDTIELVSQGLINDVVLLFSREDLKITVLADAAHIFFHATIRIHDVDCFLKKEDIEKLLNLLVCACSDIETNIVMITPLVRCLGNLSCSENWSISETLSYPLFGCCNKLLSFSKYHHIQKEVLWVLSNMLACRNSVIPSTIDISTILESLQPLLSVLDSAVMQALYFLCVLIYQHEEYCPYIASSEIMNAIKILQKCARADVVQAANTFVCLFSKCSENMLPLT